MKEEISNIRNHFRSLKMSLRDLYAKNKLSLKLTIDIKDFIKRVDALYKKFEEELPKGLQEKVAENPVVAVGVEGIKIVLKSQKGQRLDGERVCSECKMKRKPIYRYSKSNIGPVLLCNQCKSKVFDRSFGSIGPKGENLIGRAIKSGGGWETNRRRH